MSGARFIIIVFAGTVAVAAVVILAAVLVIADAGDPEKACVSEPAVCSTVREFVAARNERDANALFEILTEEGMASLLGVDSREELEQRLQLLSPGDQIEGIQINRVSLRGDEATVVARLRQGDDEFPAVYRLIRDGDGWLIDG